MFGGRWWYSGVKNRWPELKTCSKTSRLLWQRSVPSSPSCDFLPAYFVARATGHCRGGDNGFLFLSLHSKVHEHSKERRSSQRHYTCLAPFPAIAHTWACVPTSVLKYSTRAFQLYRPRCKKGPNHKTRVFTSSLNLTLLWLSGQEAVGKLGWKGRGQCGGGIRYNKCRKHNESCNCQPFVTWCQQSVRHVSRPCNTRSTEKTWVGSNVWS